MFPASEDGSVVIRSWRKSDSKTCATLYREGLIGGKLAENDTGLDIDDIEQGYMTPGQHFWVAELNGQVVGMIGVQSFEPGVAEIRRLRVSKDFQRRGIGSLLIETALKFCETHDYIKVTLDTFVERDPAIKLFEKFHFKHSRSRNVQGKEMLYFYLDLYTGGDKRQAH